MHEFALSKGIVETVLEHIADTDRVSRVIIDLGAFSGVEPESLRFCYQVVAEQTVLAGSELVLNPIPLTIRCRSCGFSGAIDATCFLCPRCESADVDILTGDRLTIKSIEVDDEQDR